MLILVVVRVSCWTQSCLTRAGGNHTVKCIVFSLWKNHVREQVARQQKIQVRPIVMRFYSSHLVTATLRGVRLEWSE